MPTTNFRMTCAFAAPVSSSVGPGPGMIGAMPYLHHASFGIGVLGVLVIVVGIGSGLLRFVRAEIRAAGGAEVEVERKRVRQVLGYYLLLGLEFLIAADVIDTLLKPSAQDLIVLGAIVLIRSVISWSLNVELKSEHQAKATAP